jgi:hypothetical protein
MIDNVITLQITKIVDATAMFLNLKLYARKIKPTKYMASPVMKMKKLLFMTHFFMKISPIVRTQPPMNRIMNGR